MPGTSGICNRTGFQLDDLLDHIGVWRILLIDVFLHPRSWGRKRRVERVAAVATGPDGTACGMMP